MSEKPPKMWHLFWTDRAEYWRQCGKIMKARKEGKSLDESKPLDHIQRDAKRYQWLRDNGYLNNWKSSDNSSNIDNEIDKAIEESKK